MTKKTTLGEVVASELIQALLVHVLLVPLEIQVESDQNSLETIFH